METDGSVDPYVSWSAREGLTGDVVYDLREALSWALDILAMYDQRLVELGEPYKIVYTPDQCAAMNKARSALTQSGHAVR